MGRGGVGRDGLEGHAEQGVHSVPDQTGAGVRRRCCAREHVLGPAVHDRQCPRGVEVVGEPLPHRSQHGLATAGG